MTQLPRLGSSHLPAIIALHHKVIADLPPGNAATETDQFFADHLDACGQIFGAFDGDRLIAYCVLGLPRETDPNFGTDHHLSPDLLGQVAHIDGVAVDPQWRGQGWQRRMVEHRIEIARKCGRTIALSTVAPTNFPSLISTVSTGLAIHGLIAKFGGNRFLLRRDIGPDQDAKFPSAPDSAIWCASDDLATCRKLLDDGLIGLFCQSSPHGTAPRIGWVPAIPA
ncbi:MULTISPECIES: GNAT family N-acetyltransferase [Thalassospira]|uniref:GNAT family N-acetyltransferase n=2 Tax=Thalassospiraceae TaxID=2844866 RepID=UPI0008DC902D|nr:MULTISPECIES: GNAT family N-acetyltransferase [Thalassospira]MAB35644.1 N-acetyltransferase [Thalassospira sp.]MBA05974.1 N-acetyltransferase [Thalassospira sp.]MDM7977723.1 GNAT family N-acetyltransferase [Thalassospira xiamenensis]OHY98894.1 hypothetical protein BC440_12915 [Thalassospira sp. MIT1004]|tara:strand:- start:66 stop:737 length:672 start_codon:yes stop_codon:yes gene_type:complete